MTDLDDVTALARSGVRARDDGVGGVERLRLGSDGVKAADHANFLQHTAGQFGVLRDQPGDTPVRRAR